MSIGDKVVIGKGTSVHGYDPRYIVEVYSVQQEANGYVKLDEKGFALPKPVGGVKGGSTGIISGEAVLTHRHLVPSAKNEGAANVGGVDFVRLIPVEFDHYKQIAYVLSDYVRVTA